jgi:transporter family protein
MNHMAPRSALLWEVLGGMSVGAVVLFISGSDIQSNIKGALPSFFTGVAGYLGLFSFLYALQVGKVSVTSSLTSVYPVITLFLAMIILKEKITLLQWTGIFFAVVSVILISYEQ